MRARGRLHQRAQNGQKGTFARPRWPQQSRQIPGSKGQVQPPQHSGFSLSPSEGLDQISHFHQRGHWPIASTGSTRAADRAGQIEARMAPMNVSRIASP